VATALVESKGLVLAFAHDRGNAALDSDRAPLDVAASAAARGGDLNLPSPDRGPAGLLRAPLRPWSRGRAEDGEVVAGDRILVFLAQEPLVDKDVQVGRQRARQFSSVQLDCAGVLLTTEDELGFHLALGRLLPDGHDNRHHHRHDAKADQKGRHRVAVLTP
jgi:hypothetical protein